MSNGASAGSAWVRAAQFSWVFLKSVTAVHVLSKYGAFVSLVEGLSMFPTFPGTKTNLVVAEAITPIWGTIKNGDVVICVRPVNPQENIIKRVVGVAGNQVTLYPDKQHKDVRTITVPEGHVWVQGDNLPQSLDSRHYGPIPIAMVRGRVFLQVQPSFKLIGDVMPHI